MPGPEDEGEEAKRLLSQSARAILENAKRLVAEGQNLSDAVRASSGQGGPVAMDKLRQAINKAYGPTSVTHWEKDRPEEEVLAVLDAAIAVCGVQPKAKPIKIKRKVNAA